MVFTGALRREEGLKLTVGSIKGGVVMKAIETGWLSIQGKGLHLQQEWFVWKVWGEAYLQNTGSFFTVTCHLPCGEDGARWYQRGDECWLGCVPTIFCRSWKLLIYFEEDVLKWLAWRVLERWRRPLMRLLHFNLWEYRSPLRE